MPHVYNFTWSWKSISKKVRESIQPHQYFWQQQRSYIFVFNPWGKSMVSVELWMHLNAWFCTSIMVQNTGHEHKHCVLHSVTTLFHQSSERKWKSKTLLVRFVSNRKQLVCFHREAIWNGVCLSTAKLCYHRNRIWGIIIEWGPSSSKSCLWTSKWTCNSMSF